MAKVTQAQIDAGHASTAFAVELARLDYSLILAANAHLRVALLAIADTPTLDEARALAEQALITADEISIHARARAGDTQKE